METDSNPKETDTAVSALQIDETRGTSRDLGKLFSRAFEIYRDNPIIIVPALLPIAALIVGVIILAGFLGIAAITGGNEYATFTAVAGFLIFLIALIVLFFLAEGITIEMVKEASMGQKADLSRAWEASRDKMEPLILSSILAGIFTVLGYILLIIPGIILSFALYFVAQAVMIDGKSGKEALATSWTFVRANLSDTLIIILASMVIEAVLPLIPAIGPLLSLLALPYLYALATLLYLDQKRALPAR
ncbi:Uncharacterised protein [uncultured archaeon]|nr:Uncharacterised protein [uncultured archaeon]